MQQEYSSQFPVITTVLRNLRFEFMQYKPHFFILFHEFYFFCFLLGFFFRVVLIFFSKSPAAKKSRN